MAFNDTLFQLGMDLTRSSTAQEEDHSRAAFITEVEDSKTSPAVEQSVSSAGTTIFIDLHGAKRLDDVKSAERATKRAVESLGLKLKSLHLDRVRRWRRVGCRGLGLRAPVLAGLLADRFRRRRRARMRRADAFSGSARPRQRLRGRARRSSSAAGRLPTSPCQPLRVVPMKAPRKAQRQKAQAKAA